MPLKEYTPTYWNQRGKRQKMYDSLWKKLVPESGRAKTYAGELLRSISKIYYDLFNNGFGNGPFTTQWVIIKEFWSDIQNVSANTAAIDKFVKAFKATNYGEYTIDFKGNILDNEYLRDEDLPPDYKQDDDEDDDAPYDAYGVIRFTDEVYEGLDYLVDAIVSVVETHAGLDTSRRR